MSTPVLKDLYGLGFSPLSISNKKYAHEEELMANKEAGLLAIYQKDGSVISADHLLRCKRHVEKFTEKCINDGTLGRLYKISPDDNLVQPVKESKNLFTETLGFDSEGEADFRFIRFSLDYDCFAKVPEAVFDPASIRVQINFTHTIKENPEPGETYIDQNGYIKTVTEGMYPENPKKSYNIEENLADINEKVYSIDYQWYPGDTANNRITLNSFDIILPADFNPTQVGFVIHDILFAIK
jgi:hypothetical protein